MRLMTGGGNGAAAPALARERLGLLLVFLVGLAAVLGLPAIATHLPHLGKTDPARWALTGTGVLLLLVAYIVTVGWRRGLPPAWAVWTSIYGSGFVIVKFILSPSAYEKSHGKSLAAFVTSGIVVMLLYVGALVVLRIVALRREQTPGSTLAIGVGLAAVAVLARFLSALALGTTSSYLHQLSRGPGLILPAIVILVAIAVLQSYRLAGSDLSTVFGLSVAIVVAWHALWVVYMYRLFG